jgi:hypothetical protein
MLKEEYTLKVFEHIVVMRMFGPSRRVVKIT